MGVIRLLGVIPLEDYLVGGYYPNNTETSKRKAPFAGGFPILALGIFLAV
jgi:hypothetical protein